MPPPLREYRVFISSPGDVSDERALARNVIERLDYQPFIRDVARLREVSWDNPSSPTPMDARFTPQEALKIGLPAPSSCDIVVVILWSRIGTKLAGLQKPDGSPYLSGTEYEFDDAVRSGKPALLVYRRTEKVLIDQDEPDAVRLEKEAQYKRVKDFFAGFRNPDGSLQRLETPYQHPSEFERKFEDDMRELLDRLSKEAPIEPTLVPEARPLFLGSPYPGLRKLTGKDSAVFYGRGREIDELIKRMRDPEQRFTAVIGASGSGKSSLVLAGLLPRLAGGALPGSKDWQFVIFSPSDFRDDPFLALAAVVKPLLKDDVRSPYQLAVGLSQDPPSIGDVCRAALKGQPVAVELVVCIDQFEELFTIISPEHLSSFERTLDELAKVDRVRVIITIRADFFPSAARFPNLAALIQQGHYLLLPPSVPALVDIIRMPAQSAGLEIEAGLLDQIIADLGSEPGALPLLAYTLQQLYNAGESSRVLTKASYDALDGLRGAISRRAEESFQELDTSAQSALPKLFSQLLNVEPSGIVTRKKADKTQVCDDAPSLRLVDKLIEARLLVSDQPGKDRIIEVAHEALFASWDRLRRWIDDSREFFLWRNRLRFRMEEWERSGRDDSAVLTGTALQEAARWAGHDVELSVAERNFIGWTGTGQYQRRRTTDSAGSLLTTQGSEISRKRRLDWLTALLVYAECDAAKVAARESGMEDLLSESRCRGALELGRQREYKQALAITAGISDDEQQWQTLSALARIAAENGNPADAISISRSIPQPEFSSYALAYALVAASQVKSEDRDLLRSAAAELETAQVANQANDGRPDHLTARALFGPWSEALKAALMRLGPGMRAEVTTRIVRMLDGPPEVVSEAAGILREASQEIADALWRGICMARAAGALCHAGLTAEAEALASAIEGPEQLRLAFAQLACAYAEAGNLEAAIAFAKKTATGWSASSTPESVPHSVIDVANNLALAGQSTTAVELTMLAHGFFASNDPDCSRTALALTRIAQTLSLCGDVDGVLKSVEAVPERWRTAAFRAIGRTLAVRGDSKTILAISRNPVLTAPERAAALSEAFLVLWGQKNQDAAAEISEALASCAIRGGQTARSYRVSISQIASCFVLAGKVDDLIATILQVEETDARAEILLSAAEQLVRDGFIDRCIDILEHVKTFTEQIEGYSQREKAFARLAVVLAHCHRLIEARDAVERCDIPDDKLWAYTEMLRCSS